MGMTKRHKCLAAMAAALLPYLGSAFHPEVVRYRGNRVRQFAHQLEANTRERQRTRAERNRRRG